MSLPNPDSVVTEERLSEFYAGIRPYLGGMPDVLANKFNKSDLYSTNEQLIGRWIDGKPLYQKTVTSISVTLSTSEYRTLCNIPNAGSIIDLQLYNGSSYALVNVSYNATINANSDVRVALLQTYGEAITRATIRYTKTTDAAVYIGSDTDYSTDEKIVGTWIDGKPIYQKTWELASAVNIGTDWTDITSIVIPNVKRVIESEGSGPDALAYSFPIIGAHDGSFFQCCTSRTNDNAVKYITIRYTKNTD